MSILARMAFFTTTALALVACKPPAADYSSTASLTDEELQFCQFNGKRISFLVAPDARFQKDVQGAREVFNEMTHTFLVSRSYIVDKFKGNPEKLKQCKAAIDQLGKYEDGPVLAGSITKAEFSTELERLRRKIESYRRSHPNSEVQIVMIFTSHGAANDAGSGGKLVLGDELVPFKEVARLIHDNVMTHDDPRNPAAKIQLADEVMILMDNCYSGNFSQELGQWLKNQAYDGGTRVLSFTASGNQTAVGQVGSSGYGTLVAGFIELINSWAADFNGDGVMTFGELIKFFNGYQAGEFSSRSVTRFQDFAANLMCVDPESRRQSMRYLKDKASFFNSFYRDPVGTVTQEEAGPMESFKIQKPSFYTNIPTENLGNLAFAVTKKGGHKLPAGEKTFNDSRNAEERAKGDLKQLAPMIEMAVKLIQSNPDKWLTNESEQFSAITTQDLGLNDNSAKILYQAIAGKCQERQNGNGGGGDFDSLSPDAYDNPMNPFSGDDDPGEDGFGPGPFDGDTVFDDLP